MCSTTSTRLPLQVPVQKASVGMIREDLGPEATRSPLNKSTSCSPSVQMAPFTEAFYRAGATATYSFTTSSPWSTHSRKRGPASGETAFSYGTTHRRIALRCRWGWLDRLGSEYCLRRQPPTRRWRLKEYLPFSKQKTCCRHWLPGGGNSISLNNSILHLGEQNK